MILDTISEEKKEEAAEDSPALTGSLSALYGGVNPYLYNQFNLHVREQKINQITLLKVITFLVVLINDYSQDQSCFICVFASRFKYRKSKP